MFFPASPTTVATSLPSVASGIRIPSTTKPRLPITHIAVFYKLCLKYDWISTYKWGVNYGLIVSYKLILNYELILKYIS